MGQENERMSNPLEAPAHTTAKETREADSNAGIEMATPRHAIQMTRHHRCITTLPWYYWTRCHPRPMMNLSTLWGPTVAACLPAHCRVLGSLSSPAIRSLQHASIVIRISTGKLCGDILHVSLGSCPCGNLVVSPALLSPKLHAAPPLSLRLLHPSSGSEMQSG